MDWKLFVVELLKATAWPLTTLIVIFALKQPIRRLLLAARTVKWAGLEAEFGERLQAARALADASVVTRGQAVESVRTDALSQLANLSPRAAVLESWRAVESAVVRALARTGKNKRSPFSEESLQTLVHDGVIDDSERNLLDVLRHLRNRAVHQDAFTISKDDAVEFALMAQRLTATLEVGRVKGTIS